jgi:hypothetical protein
MYNTAPEPTSTAYFTNPSISNTSTATTFKKPLLSYSHSHFPVVHPVPTDEALNSKTWNFLSPGLVPDAVVVNNNARCLAAAADVSFQLLSPRSLFVIFGWLDGNLVGLSIGCDVYEFME